MRFIALVWLLCVSLYAEDRVLTVTCADVVAAGKPLVIHALVRSGKPVWAVAAAPGWNRVRWAVDPAQLQVDDDSLAGSMSLSLTSDGYIPPVGTQIPVKVTLAGQTWKGTRSGDAVAGSATSAWSAATIPDPVRFTIHGDNCVFFPKHGPGKGRRMTVVVPIAQGAAHAVRLVPPGSPTDTGCSATVTSSAVRRDGPRLSATIASTIRHQGGATSAAVMRFEALVVGEQLHGLVTTTWDGKEQESGWCIGSALAGVPDPQTAQLRLTLDALVSHGGYCDLYLNLRDGKVTSGFATTPNDGNSTHVVDRTDLVWADGKITGGVRLTLMPDPWKRPVAAPTQAQVQITAAVRGADASGTYTGTFGTTAVTGEVVGGLDPAVTAGRLKSMTIKVENGLSGGNEYQNRAFITVQLDGQGKVIGGKVSNNHTALDGSVSSGLVQVTDGRLIGTVEATIGAAGKTTSGLYRFAYEGVAVGNLATGGFTVTDPAGAQKSERFWAALVRE